MLGPLQVVTDNEAEIRAQIAEYNEGSPCDEDLGEPQTGDETGDEEASAITDGGGCRVAPVGAGGLLGFAFALLGFTRRRLRIRATGTM